jgi:hypothetical protein
MIVFERDCAKCPPFEPTEDDQSFHRPRSCRIAVHIEAVTQLFVRQDSVVVLVKTFERVKILTRQLIGGDEPVPVEIIELE